MSSAAACPVSSPWSAGAVTAAAAMILVEEAKLRLDDPVDRWLPELADRKVLRAIDGPLDDTVPAKRAITLRDLLTFRLGHGAVMVYPERYPIQQAMAEAGIAPGPNLPAFPADALMKRYGGLPLLHQPGEKWLYNSGSDILGVLIARVSGQTLEAFLRERIFAPLGMKDTGFSVPEAKLDRLATCYRTDPAHGLAVFDEARGGRFARPPLFESGAGGLVSTVDDLSIITRRDDLAAVPGRFGWDGGYGTSAYMDPKEDMVAILMTQRLWESPRGPDVCRDFWTSVYQAIDD